MSESNEFKTWAVVEVMGHATYIGYVTVETIAGIAMLRIDVPESKNISAFTKYIAPGALYGISPVTETTAREILNRNYTKPVSVFGVEEALLQKLKNEGRLIEAPKGEDFDDPIPY